jgi:hypothetical protein
MKLSFELTVHDYNVIVLTWNHPLGKLLSEPYHAVAESLYQVDGVDRVEVLRYSAHVYVAAHVQQLMQVLEDIRDQLYEDEHLRLVLNECGVVDYGITMNPDILVRRE